MTHFDAFGLTFKQRIFCDRYLDTKNGAQAAIAAGYSKNCAKEIASETLTKPNVKKYLGEKMKDVFEKLGVTLEYKVGKLKTVVDRCIPEEENKRLMGKTGIDAIAELNKMAGHYAPTTANLKVEATELSQASEIAKECEKEIEAIPIVNSF